MTPCKRPTALTDNMGYPVTSLANMTYTRIRRFPLAFVDLAAEDQRQGNPVDWSGLALAESTIQGISAATLNGILVGPACRDCLRDD